MNAFFFPELTNVSTDLTANFIKVTVLSLNLVLETFMWSPDPSQIIDCLCQVDLFQCWGQLSSFGE